MRPGNVLYGITYLFPPRTPFSFLIHRNATSAFKRWNTRRGIQKIFQKTIFINRDHSINPSLFFPIFPLLSSSRRWRRRASAKFKEEKYFPFHLLSLYCIFTTITIFKAIVKRGRRKKKKEKELSSRQRRNVDYKRETVLSAEFFFENSEFHLSSPFRSLSTPSREIVPELFGFLIGRPRVRSKTRAAINKASISRSTSSYVHQFFDSRRGNKFPLRRRSSQRNFIPDFQPKSTISSHSLFLVSRYFENRLGYFSLFLDCWIFRQFFSFLN